MFYDTARKNPHMTSISGLWSKDDRNFTCNSNQARQEMRALLLLLPLNHVNAAEHGVPGSAVRL